MAKVMNDKERMVLVGILAAQLGPLLDHWAVPKDDQGAVVGWIVAGLFVGYHAIAQFVSVYGPRLMAKWLPQGPAAGPSANSPAAASAPEQGSPVPFPSSQR